MLGQLSFCLHTLYQALAELSCFSKTDRSTFYTERQFSISVTVTKVHIIFNFVFGLQVKVDFIFINKR